MKQTIGFIGLGNIGNPMAMQVLKQEGELYIYDVSAASAENLIKAGASFEENIPALAKKCDLIFLSLPGPDEVSQVMGEILPNISEQSIVLDLTTSSVEKVRMIEKTALEKGIYYLDAPVSGGSMGAEAANLTVLVSGNEAALEKSRQAIEAFGSNIVYFGDSVGTGTLIKLANNQILFAVQALCAEALVLAAKAGMDAKRTCEILRTCSSASFLLLADLFVNRDFDSVIFPTVLANKDMAMALESARELGVSMPVTEAAQALYERGVDSGLARENFSSIIKLLEADANIDSA